MNNIISLNLKYSDFESDGITFNVKLKEQHLVKENAKCYLVGVIFYNTVPNTIIWNHLFRLKIDQINHINIKNKINQLMILKMEIILYIM